MLNFLRTHHESSSSNDEDDMAQCVNGLLKFAPNKNIVQSSGKQIIRCSNVMEWKIVTNSTVMANASTLVELSLYGVNATSEEIALPNLKRLTIFYDYDDNQPKMPQINLSCLTKFETLILSYFNEAVIDCLKSNKNLKVLKLGEKLHNADERQIAEQLFTEALPFKLKELISDESYDHENFTKFLAVQLKSLKRLKLREAKVEEIAMIINNSKLVDLCLGGIADEKGTETARFEKLKALITKPNKFIHKLYLDMHGNHQIVLHLCLKALNVVQIDISELDNGMVELFAKNLMQLKRLNSHEDEIGYDSNGKDYFDDADDEDGEEGRLNPIQHYKNIVETSGSATAVNKNIRFHNYRDKDLRFGNEYSLNTPWRR